MELAIIGFGQWGDRSEKNNIWRLNIIKDTVTKFHNFITMRQTVNLNQKEL